MSETQKDDSLGKWPILSNECIRTLNSVALMLEKNNIRPKWIRLKLDVLILNNTHTAPSEDAFYLCKLKYILLLPLLQPV